MTMYDFKRKKVFDQYLVTVNKYYKKTVRTVQYSTVQYPHSFSLE